MVHFGPRIVQELMSHHRDIHIHLMVERKSENHRSEYVLHGLRNPSETLGNLELLTWNVDECELQPKLLTKRQPQNPKSTHTFHDEPTNHHSL